MKPLYLLLTSFVLAGFFLVDLYQAFISWTDGNVLGVIGGVVQVFLVCLLVFLLPKVNKY